MKAPKGNHPLLRRPPLYQQAADLLRGKLRDMSPGDQLPSERILSEQFGVSMITLREAIRILTSEGLLNRVQGRGTFVCEPPELNQSWVALMIHHNISDPNVSSIHMRIAQEIRVRLDDAGIPSRLYISRRSSGLQQNDFHCPEFFEDLEANRISGTIGVLLSGVAPWVATLQDRGLMLLGFGENKPFTVNTDIEFFYRSAIRELIKRGKRRLGMIAWGGYSKEPSYHRDFFRKAMQEEGLPIKETWIHDTIYPSLDGSGWKAFREIWEASPKKPDGIIVSDDLYMNGVATAIYKGDIAVPGQLELAVLVSHDVSFHAIPTLNWQPDVAGIAKLIADAQIALSNGKKVMPERVLVTPQRILNTDAVDPHWALPVNS